MKYKVDMEMEVYKGLLNTDVYLKAVNRTKRKEKALDIVMPMPNTEEDSLIDFKQAIDYIKNNNINVVNKEEFEWLK
ncbi:MAG: hypothetical protein ACYSTS_19530 [Planctomycetota bacterium]|jgi:hypothetical protein